MRPLDSGHKDHLDLRYEADYRGIEGSLMPEWRNRQGWRLGAIAVFIALVFVAYHSYSMEVAALVCLLGIFLVLYNSLHVASVSAQMIDLRLKELNWRIKELQDAQDERASQRP